MRYKTAWLLTAVFVTGCSGISASVDFCAVYRPVPTLSCGTESESLAVDQNNAVYDGFCR